MRANRVPARKIKMIEARKAVSEIRPVARQADTKRKIAP
jgi:hypothetical protein